MRCIRKSSLWISFGAKWINERRCRDEKNESLIFTKWKRWRMLILHALLIRSENIFYLKLRRYYGTFILWHLLFYFLVSFSAKVPKKTNFGKWTSGGRKSLEILHWKLELVEASRVALVCLPVVEFLWLLWWNCWQLRCNNFIKVVCDKV